MQDDLFTQPDPPYEPHDLTVTGGTLRGFHASHFANGELSITRDDGARFTLRVQVLAHEVHREDA